jgi:hypothetical protein
VGLLQRLALHLAEEFYNFSYKLTMFGFISFGGITTLAAKPN